MRACVMCGEEGSDSVKWGLTIIRTSGDDIAPMRFGFCSYQHREMGYELYTLEGAYRREWDKEESGR